jgi:hypothetical protein
MYQEVDETLCTAWVLSKDPSSVKEHQYGSQPYKNYYRVQERYL